MSDNVNIFTTKKGRLLLQFIFILVIICASVTIGFSQTGLNYSVQSTYNASIKDAIKFTELPEIKDTAKRMKDIPYGITSSPLFPKYDVEPIKPAKMQNEPLTKLYRSLLKVGYSPFYNMPYGEAWINSTRTRDIVYGVHYKHLSSSSQLDGTGYSGFSDNEAEVFGKKFYKKHTLTGEFNYKRNLVHFYGYDTTLSNITDNNLTRQRYQLFEPKLTLQSHYTDSSKINHTVRLSYYNLQDLYYAEENNIKLNTKLNTFINKEHFHVNFLADYYNHRKPKDTINNMIVSINPYFEANGTKWHADLGLTATADNWDQTKFYFYPQLNAFYDVYESILIPYAGISGGLQKNSMRSLSNENPFIDPQLNYTNTNNKFNFFGGLRGNLSSNTSYDTKFTYGQYENMHFFVIDYSTPVQLYNKFTVLYGNSNLMTVSGQLKYQYKEKMHFIAKGNYYNYQTKTFSKPFHKPTFDMTFSGIYNLKSKIILKADIFMIGNQWAFTQEYNQDLKVYDLKPKLLNSIVDVNLGAEYRYSKFLSFFTTFNNIANMRYYRWERYPTQRFSFMLGVTFIPF